MSSLTTALQRRVDEFVQEAIRRDDQPLPSRPAIARALGCSVKTVQRVVGSEYTQRRLKRGAELRRLAHHTCACGNRKSRQGRQCIRCKAKSQLVPELRCPDCGGRKRNRSAKRCRSCHMVVARAARGQPKRE